MATDRCWTHADYVKAAAEHRREVEQLELQNVRLVEQMELLRSKKGPTGEDMLLWLWDMYVNKTCWCSMDYHTTCRCEAQWEVGQKLEELLGSNWHEIMRAKTGVA